MLFCGCEKDNAPKVIKLPEQELLSNIIVGGDNYIVPLKVNTRRPALYIPADTDDNWYISMDECTWCRFTPTEGDRNHTSVTLHVDKNDTPSERSIKFSIVYKDQGRSETYTLLQGVPGSGADAYVEIECTRGGELAAKLDALPVGKAGLTRLRISGTMDNTDCETLANVLPAMSNLQCLDMENALIEKFADRTFCGNTSIYLLTIPRTLTSIGKAFYADGAPRNKIYHIVVPADSELTRIDDHAFRNCSSLHIFDVPESVTYIGSYAFYNCQYLNSDIVIPKGAEIIRPYTYYRSGQRFPEGFEFPATLREIGERAFYDCRYYPWTVPLVFPNSLTTIGEAAFCYSTLAFNRLPQQLEVINDSTFYGCAQLGKLVFPASVKRIGAYSFGGSYGYSNVWQIELNEGLESIGDFAFAYNYDLSGDLNIPGSVRTIGESAFVGCENLTGRLTLNEGLQEIGTAAFSYSKLSDNLTIPSTLTAIGDSAFFQSTIGGTLEIPAATTRIGVRAFSGCRQLSGLNIDRAVNLATLGESAFEDCTAMTGSINIPPLLTVIPPSLFKNSAINGQLTLPEGVTRIEQEAFYSTQVAGVSLPSTLSYIGDGAFWFCRQLAGELALPEGLTYLGKAAFSGCSGLTGTLTLPPALTRIENEAFYGGKFTGDLIIHDRITYIGTGAFQYWRAAKGLHLGTGVKSIDNHAFASSYFEGELVIPDNVETIGVGTFQYSKYTSMTIGTGLKFIGANAFYGHNLRTVTCHAVQPPVATEDCFHSGRFDLYVPAAAVELYKNAEEWREAKSINPIM
jgi:hypothetical protein